MNERIEVGDLVYIAFTADDSVIVRGTIMQEPMNDSPYWVIITERTQDLMYVMTFCTMTRISKRNGEA